MAFQAGKITLDTTVLDALVRNLDRDIAGVVASIAFKVEGAAKDNIIMKDIIDTGNLLGETRAIMIEPDLWWVVDGTEYGIYQELGTYKMPARPFMTPAVEAVSNQVAEIVAKELFK